MPGQAADRRARGLTTVPASTPAPLGCQVLWHRVTIEATDPDVRAALGLMVQGAVHQVAPVAQVRMAVTATDDGGYEVFDRGDLLARVATPRQVLDEVFARVHRRAFELASLRGWVRFHGAVVGIGDSRLALVGASGVGKTTLAASLLAGGALVETDESFVARQGEVFSVARRLHVKPGTAALLDDGGWVEEAPVLDGDPPLRVVDPTEHGFGWSVRSGTVDAVVLVERTDGPSTVDPIGASVVVQRLIAESFPVSETRADVVRQASALVRSTPTFVLGNGTDRSAPGLLVDLGSAPAGPGAAGPSTGRGGR